MAVEGNIRNGTIIINAKIIADGCINITGLHEVVNGIEDNLLGIGTELFGSRKLMEEDRTEFDGAIFFSEAKGIFQIKQDVTDTIMIQFHRNTSFPMNHSILDGEKQEEKKQKPQTGRGGGKDVEDDPGDHQGRKAMHHCIDCNSHSNECVVKVVPALTTMGMM